jgi:hypothetical protein
VQQRQAIIAHLIGRLVVTQTPQYLYCNVDLLGRYEQVDVGRETPAWFTVNQLSQLWALQRRRAYAGIGELSAYMLTGELKQRSLPTARDDRSFYGCGEFNALPISGELDYSRTENGQQGARAKRLDQ